MLLWRYVANVIKAPNQLNLRKAFILNNQGGPDWASWKSLKARLSLPPKKKKFLLWPATSALPTGFCPACDFLSWPPVGNNLAYACEFQPACDGTFPLWPSTPIVTLPIPYKKTHRCLSLYITCISVLGGGEGTPPTPPNGSAFQAESYQIHTRTETKHVK